MSGRWSVAVVLSGLVIVVAGPLLLQALSGGKGGRVLQGGAEERLIILTPHNEQIRTEIAAAFNRWRREHGLRLVFFDWRTGGGTSDLRRMVLAEFQKKAQEGREEEGIGYDLFFGGGDYEHNLLARGVRVWRGGQEISIPVTVPLELPEEFREEVFPQAEIGGAALYHPEWRWVGVVLSSFGIVYNREVLGMLGVGEPRTWADLAEPRLAGWVALSDPAHSGSIAVTYETILRRMGWMEGWALLRRVFANARYFTASSSRVPVDVSAGEAAAGMCIDFYGRFQAGAIGGGRLGYVDPPFMTAVTADPVAILRGAPSRRAAEAAGKRASESLADQFVRWLLSQEAQVLWQRRVDAAVEPRPVRFELRRMPVRRDVYRKEEMVWWTDPVNPYEIARAVPAEMPSFYPLVAPVAHAMAIDIHDELRGAWAAINRLKAEDARRAAAVEIFDAMPPELTLRWPDAELAEKWREILESEGHPRRGEVAAVLRDFWTGLQKRYDNFRDTDRLLEDRLRWTQFFRGQYQRVVELAGKP